LWMEWTRNQRGIWTSCASNRAAGGANLIRLNQDVQQLLVTLLFLGGLTADHGLATKRNGLFGRRVWVEPYSGKRSVGEGCGENNKCKGLGWASRGCPCAVWEREIIFPRACVQVLIA